MIKSYNLKTILKVLKNFNLKVLIAINELKKIGIMNILKSGLLKVN